MVGTHDPAGLALGLWVLRGHRGKPKESFGLARPLSRDGPIGPLNFRQWPLKCWLCWFPFQGDQGPGATYFDPITPKAAETPLVARRPRPPFPADSAKSGLTFKAILGNSRTTSE